MSKVLVLKAIRVEAMLRSRKNPVVFALYRGLSEILFVTCVFFGKRFSFGLNIRNKEKTKYH